MDHVLDMRGRGEAVWFQGVDARSRFITRTYLHLLGAIGAFTLIEMVLFASGAAEAIAVRLTSLPGGWLPVLAGFMLVSWIASRVAHGASSLGAQYAALTAFIGAEALIFVPLLYVAERAFAGVITSAAVVTLTGFGMLTFVAIWTRKDFSFLRGVLMWGGVSALLLIVAAVIFGLNLGPVLVVAMIAFAGAAILYDTSNVLHHYPEERYVGAALELFASVALLFWYVLQFFMSRDD